MYTSKRGAIKLHRRAARVAAAARALLIVGMVSENMSGAPRKNFPMRPLKLHTKTTLLASAITVAVLVAATASISVRVAQVVREEQKALAELQAVNLAEHIARLPAPHDAETLARVAGLVRGSRPGIVGVRVWERAGGVFVPRASAGDLSTAEIPEETKAALRSGLASRSVERVAASGLGEPSYRVFAPVTEDGRLSGAVEVVEQLDDAPSIALRYASNIVWMMLLAVALLTLATYLLFRKLVYRPVQRLLLAMSRARSGDLKAEAPSRAPDELGMLSEEFNRMIAQLRGMTGELEAQQRTLQERVRGATAELAQRNEQLADANLQLWQTTRRLTELERLAAAGQTAAQLAHEVGTPLNLISGHVQLLRLSLDPDSRAAARLQTVAGQIERIERIVRRMLDRTRPETFEPVSLDLNALLARIFDATAPTLEARNVRLDASLSPTLPPIEGNPDRLQQLFINLVNNALDAMPEGGELKVATNVEPSNEIPPTGDGAGDRERTGTQGDGRHGAGGVERGGASSIGRGDASSGKSGGTSCPAVVVEFVDVGCGMTPDTRAHIFDPFFTTKERGRGTGLGLVVVNQVIEEHHGHVEVETEPGRGTRFRLRFPVASQATHDATLLATANAQR